jgi:Tfp pilus assembly protein PilZ
MLVDLTLCPYSLRYFVHSKILLAVEVLVAAEELEVAGSVVETRQLLLVCMR